MSRVSLFWSRVLGPTVARYGWYLVVIPLVLAVIGGLFTQDVRDTFARVLTARR